MVRAPHSTARPHCAASAGAASSPHACHPGRAAPLAFSSLFNDPAARAREWACETHVDVPWLEVGRPLILPSITLNAAYITAVVAAFGTTISSYLFFWQAEEEVEDEKELLGARPLTVAPEQAPAELQRIRIDTYIGMAFSNIIALFIVLTTAATRYH
jgi:hypothetical protein